MLKISCGRMGPKTSPQEIYLVTCAVRDIFALLFKVHTELSKGERKLREIIKESKES